MSPAFTVLADDLPLLREALHRAGLELRPSGALDGAVTWRVERVRPLSAATGDAPPSLGVFENNHAVMLAVDPADGRIVDANPAAVRFYGWPREVMRRMHIGDINALPSEQVAEFMARASGADQRYFEFEHRLADGRRRDVEVFSGPVVVDGREILISIVHDVTERRRTARALHDTARRLEASLAEGEAARREAGRALEGQQGALSRLAESARRYRLLFESNPHPMWIYDVETRAFLAVNDTAVRRYGYSREEFLAMTLDEIRTTDETVRLKRHLASTTGVVQESGVWHHRTRNGDVRLVEIASHALDWAGRPARLVLAHDVTERQQLEAQLLRAQRMEAIGALAAGLAHDLNNILAPVLMIGPLLRDVVSDAESLELLETVERSAQRGAGIIRQLLTFARGVPGERVPLPIEPLLREIVRLLRETIPRTIDVSLRVVAGLRPARGDVTQLHQVLMNLCVNARDAIGDVGRLALEADNVDVAGPLPGATPAPTPGAYVRLRVTDTGAGIPPEYMDRLFEPFFTTKAVGEGTGLGLSTVLGIVRSHGGFVRVESDVGTGTAFEVYLPVDATAHAGEPDPARAAPAPRGRGQLVLVVDDEEGVRRTLRRTLESHGYRVMTAGNGREGLTLLGEHHDDVALIITDLMMPVMGGAAMVAALRQWSPALPVIGVTGLADQAASPAALGLSSLLSKPFSTGALLDAVHRALSGAPPGGPATTRRA